MAKKTALSVSSGYQSTTQLNNEFADIADHLNNKVLYRDNPSGESNQMENDLDMNSKKILNLPSPETDNEPARRVDLTDLTQFTADTVPAQPGNSLKYLGTDGSNLLFRDQYPTLSGEVGVTDNQLTEVEIDQFIVPVPLFSIVTSCALVTVLPTIAPKFKEDLLSDIEAVFDAV